MRLLRHAYPLLAAVVPLLSLAAQWPGWFAPSDAVVLAAVTIAATALVELLLYGVIRSWRASDSAGDLAAFVTFVMVAAFYIVEPFPLGAVKAFTAAHPIVVLLVVSVGVSLGVLGVRRGLAPDRPTLAGVGRSLAAGVLLLTGWSVARLAYYRVVSEIAICRSVLVDSLARPVPLLTVAQRAARGVPGVAPGSPKRDVYVILLDEYASAAVLREQLGIDNTAFEDSLRALGFRIPAELRSNYAVTLVSIASLLNFSQVRPIQDDLPRGWRDYMPGTYLLHHNRAGRFLQGQGYRFVFFPSSWYAPTRHGGEADEEYDPYRRLDVGRLIYRSEFASQFLRTTPIRRLLRHVRPFSAVHADHTVHTFRGLTALARDTAPTFAFAHVLMPHGPYVVDASCRQTSRRRPAGVAAAQELQCLNGQLLRMVHTLIDSSRVPSIIILQGDHGTQRLKPFASYSGLPTPAQARERFRPFGAYYLPDGGGAVIPDSTSLVNVLRYVFSYYFGADLPPVPNTMYYSHWRHPFDFAEIGPNFRVVPAAKPGR